MPELKIKISGDSTQYGHAVRGVISANNRMASSIGILGRFFAPAAIAGGIVAGIQSVARWASELADWSDRTGESVATVSKLKQAADEQATSLDAVMKAIKLVAKSQQAALGSNKEMIHAYGLLGVTLDDLRNKDYKTIFNQIAQSMEGIQPTGAQLDAMLKTMGKSAQELIPLFKSGALLKDWAVPSEDNTRAVDDLGDAWTRAWNKIKVGGIDFAGWFARNILSPAKNFWTGTELNLSNAALPLPPEIEAAKSQKRALQDAEDMAAQDKEAQRLKDAKEIAKIEEKIAETKRDAAFDAATDAEKRKMLLQEIQQQNAIRLGLFGGGPVAQKEAELEMLKRQSELAKLNKSIADRQKDVPFASDALRNVGLYIGGSSGQSIANRQLREFVEMRRLMQLTYDRIAKGL